MTAISRGFVASAEGQIHYRAAGSGGAPIVLLHQSPQSSASYQLLQPLLAEKHRVYAFDSPGFGDSYTPGRAYSVADFAAAMVEAMDALELSAAAVVGNHTGSTIAVEMAAAYPRRVTHLVAIGLPLWDEAERRQRTEAAAREAPRKIEPDGTHFTNTWKTFGSRQPTATPEVLLRRVIDYYKAPDPSFGYHALWNYDIFERIPAVSCPALVMAGSQDGLAGHTEAGAKLFPHGEALLLADTGGYVLDDAADRVADEIESFLNRHE
jgi:pimeloyl-ACP methyl ester carboxylesterase